MQLHINGNIDITPAIKEFSEKKLSQLSKHTDHVKNIIMKLHVEHRTHTAEATIQIDGADLHASAKEEDMYKAIDILFDKLEGQIVKHKDKIIDSHRQPPSLPEYEDGNDKI